MGKGSYRITKPNQTSNAVDCNLAVRRRELSSDAEGERAQTAS